MYKKYLPPPFFLDPFKKKLYFEQKKNKKIKIITPPTPTIFCWTNWEKKWIAKKLIYIYILPLSFFSLHGNGDTIRIGQEIQCLSYAGFSPTRPHWAGLVIESPCPSVCLFVCLRHRVQFFLGLLLALRFTWSDPEKIHATFQKRRRKKKFFFVFF